MRKVEMHDVKVDFLGRPLRPEKASEIADKSEMMPKRQDPSKHARPGYLKKYLAKRSAGTIDKITWTCGKTLERFGYLRAVDAD
ncbi:MAG: hypothetical protein AAF636_04605 [Pseudomonadota bacterium]